MKRTATTALLLSTALLLAATGCGGDDGTDAGGKKTVTLTLNWVPYGEHAPFYYGLSKGYYAAEGIDLKIQPGNGSGNTIKQVAQKQTDFGWADSPVLVKSVASGMPVRSIGSYLEKGPASVEFFAEKNIKTPQDLKGKTVGGTPGDALYATFPAWLERNGLTKSDVKVVNVDAAGKIAALAEGKVDAIMGFFHDQAPTIENKTGKKVDVLLFADYGMNLLGTGLVANTQTLEKDPELARRFVRATQKSWTEAAKDTAGAVTAMAELAENEPPAEVLTKQLTLALPLIGTDEAPGVNTEAQWGETVDLMSRYAELKDPGAPTAYWDASYAAKG
ncbi:ABC transporter substrate-binding protein [Micromonospora endolithica]|uniref:Sulfonate ABC transporter substrate-binding protein n=1 Tax=Micromonospora endolithica TaxID=230091 RepID=A0A3A9ZH98_9ACTN|nr:ABC transporter substrate-binding protein [Micromonospora endolithica]RKN47882.1 sulfonate ABC transporter substrate-binding protein [Micromonospora endolithica]TWJ21581.1 NitT/TauT family transport system substrate-binding protein [Micromonospora endolithica]